MGSESLGLDHFIQENKTMNIQVASKFRPLLPRQEAVRRQVFDYDRGENWRRRKNEAETPAFLKKQAD
jgi:hypothetical protein